MKIASLFLSLFAAGILSAQTAAPRHAGPRLQKLTADLNLTVDQQAQAKSIFQKSHQQARALAPQLRQQRDAMNAAIKSGNEAQVDQLAQQGAQLRAQMQAIHAKAMAGFYQILTPDQKTKMDQRMSSARRPMRGIPQAQGNAVH